MYFIMHVVLKILLPLLGKFHTHISGFFARNQHSSLGGVFLFLFLTSSAFSESFTEYQFEWNSSTKSFMLDGDSSPTLVLYEHCSYLIRSVGAEFSISENNSTHYEGDDIFFNEGIQGNGEYILLTPDQNSLRRLYYQNFGTTDSLIGTIEIKEFDNLGLLRMNQPESFANFGANVVLSDDLTLFASAPGFNENEGLVIQSSYQTDGSYVNESNIFSPTGETTFWGSSLYFDNNQSQLLIGSSNAADFRGSLYAYSLSTHQNKLLLEGEDMGDLLGWSFATYNEKLIVSALSVTDPRGGYFSIFTNAYSTPFVLHDKVQPEYPQFGNEYGYDISIFEDWIAVGAPGEDDLSRQDSGAVYLYRLEENNLESYKILSSIRNDGDRFGHSVLVDSGIMFVGAPSGDGSSTKSGLVYIFDCRDEALGIKEIFRLLPPNEGASQNFSQDISVVGDFVFVSSTGAEEVGAVYVFKKTGPPDAYTWELVNSIPLSLFSNDLSPSDKISIDVKKGVLAIGLEKESANEIEAGAVQILRNPAWNISYQLPIPPFFRFDSPSTLTIEEDSAEVAIDFNASLPIGFNSDLVWEVNSSSPLISLEDYEINSSSGAFNFYPPSNLNGTIPFTLSVHANNQKVVHDFQVFINQIEDEPYFVDFNSAENHPNILPVATVGEEYNYVFQIFDADLDELTLSVVNADQLPGGLSLTGKNFVGTPLIEGNFTFQLSLTDGKSNDVVESFSIQIFPANAKPVVFFLGDQLTSPAIINLEFSQNFSLSDWLNSINSLNISDDHGQTLAVEIVEPPLSGGFLSVPLTFEEFSNSLVRYSPPFNFIGDDRFILRFTDDHLGATKSFDLTFNIFIQSNNNAPYIKSVPQKFSVPESTFFQHSFEVFDAEEDFYELTFFNLPTWIKFDGRRKIFGTPERKDYKDSPEPTFVSAKDQWGNSFSDKFIVEIVPRNYPPLINYLGRSESDLSFNLSEDTSLTFELSAQDIDSDLTSFIWTTLLEPMNGNILLNSNDSNLTSITYTPDGNFSGSDYFEISVAEEFDEFAYDIIRVHLNINTRPDIPKFLSMPYPGVVLGKPWYFEVHGLDGDLNDHLTLTTADNLPGWLRLDQTSKRSWSFRGLPLQYEDVNITLFLSDSNTTIEHSFNLYVIESLEELDFLPSDQISLINSPEYPKNKICNIVIEEDSNWFANELSVNSIEDVKVEWRITKSPKNGDFTFDTFENGTIHNINYNPNPNFYGFDEVEIEAFDNYSSIKLKFNIEVKSVPDEIKFIEIPSGVLESSEENFDFTISYQDGDGLSTLNDIVLDGFPSWIEQEILFEDEISKSIRFYGVPEVEHIGTSQLSVTISDSNGNFVTSSFFIRVNFYNKPPVPSVESIFEKITEDVYSEGKPKIWTNFISVIDEETKDPDKFSWVVLSKPNNGSAQISETGDWMTYFPEHNFSGFDTFSIQVTDQAVFDENGVFIGSPRSVVIPISIEVTHVNDKPVFTSFPPSKSNSSSTVVWTDEESFRYEVIVDDSDWPWQGFPSLKLNSSLPTWAQWETIGKGQAIITGEPKWFDEGNYTFNISASSGTDVVSQVFVLEIRVYDYPPRIFDSSGKELSQRIQVFIDEDNHKGEVDNKLSGLVAKNPDKRSGETLMWVPYNSPTSGGAISLKSILNADKSIASIEDFTYTIPIDFNGIDTFSLLADEGDRFTIIKVDVHVKAVPDPPAFINAGPLDLKVKSDSFIDYKIDAKDPDGEDLTYRLLYPNNLNKWLTIKEFTNDYVRISGIAPKAAGFESFSLVVSDTTGRFSILSIYIEIE